MPSSVRSVICPVGDRLERALGTEHDDARRRRSSRATNVVSMVTVAPPSVRSQRGEPVLRGAACASCRRGRGARRCRCAARALASTMSPKVQRRKSIDVRAPRADPAAAALARRTASRTAASGRGSRRRTRSTGRARRCRPRRPAAARAARTRPGWWRNSKLSSATAPASPRGGLHRARRRRSTCRTACRRARPCPASSAAVDAAARWRNGGECTATRSTSGCSHSARTASSSRGETTSTTRAPVGLVEHGRDDRAARTPAR